MGRKEFVASLKGIGSFSLDTSSVIYYLSGYDQRHALVRDVLDCVAKQGLELQFSAMTEMELIVRPLRERDRVAQRRVMALLEGSPGARVTPISRGVLMAAAEIRAWTGMKAPDAIIAAGAVVYGCEAIVGNDKSLQRLGKVDLEQWVAPVLRDRPLPRYFHLDDYLD